MLLGKFLRAAAGAEDDADLALFLERHGDMIERGIFEGFRRRGHRQRNNARYVLAFARVDPSEFVEAGNLPRNVHRQAAGIEARDALDARLPGQNGTSKCVVPDPVGADHTHSCNDDARQHARASLM